MVMVRFSAVPCVPSLNQLRSKSIVPPAGTLYTGPVVPLPTLLAVQIVTPEANCVPGSLTSLPVVVVAAVPFQEKVAVDAVAQ